jgi:hypothetical protein
MPNFFMDPDMLGKLHLLPRDAKQTQCGGEAGYCRTTRQGHIHLSRERLVIRYQAEEAKGVPYCGVSAAAGLPVEGLLVLEVKDWRMDTIASATKSDVELVTTSGSVRPTSPFEQARGYMFDVMKLIQSDGILLHPPGHTYQGKSIVPFGYGVVFTNLTRKQFAQTDLHEVFPEDRCVFKDEMSESVDAEVFRTRLWKMVPPRIGSP